MIFLHAELSMENRFQPKSQKWSWDWYIMIKMTEKLTALFIGIRWDQNDENALKHGSGEFSDQDWLQNIYHGSSKMSSSTAWIPKFLIAYSCHSTTHRWEFDSAWVDGSRRYSHTNGKSSCFIENAHLIALQSPNQDSSLGGEKAEKEDRPFSSRPLNPFGDNPDEEKLDDDLSKPRKVNYHSKWKTTQDAVFWVNLARAQDKGLRFWQKAQKRTWTNIAHGRPRTPTKPHQQRSLLTLMSC